MVDCHGKKKQLSILTSVAHTMTKNTLYFGGLGQITDTITRFWSMNEMYWVSNYILQTCNKVLKFQQTVVTFALTV